MATARRTGTAFTEHGIMYGGRGTVVTAVGVRCVPRPSHARAAAAVKLGEHAKGLSLRPCTHRPYGVSDKGLTRRGKVILQCGAAETGLTT